MKKPQKNILITGGAGFVGSHLSNALLKEGHKITVLDNLSTGRKKNIKKLFSNTNFKFIKGDICRVNLNNYKFDQIYNLASPASPPAYQKNPIQTLRTNIIGIINMCELAKKTGAVLLQASTSEIYGNPLEHPQKESYWGNVNPIGIRSCYDESKRAAETLIMDYHRQHKLKVRIIRIFNTYGPNMDQNDGRVVSNLITQALKNKPLTIFGSGSQTRSFQYIDDLIEGMIKMMNNKKNFIGPVNLGNPQEFTIQALAKLILKLLPNSKSKIIKKALPADDPLKRKPDITLAKKMLNWSPKTSTEEGLTKTINYFKSI